jgi:hypothetical protein
VEWRGRGGPKKLPHGEKMRNPPLHLNKEIIDEFASRKARKNKFSKFKFNTVIIAYKCKLYTQKKW